MKSRILSSLFLLCFLLCSNAWSCDGNTLIFENLYLCVKPQSEINLDIVNSEPVIYLTSESEGSLSLSIRNKEEANEKPFFDMEPGDEISSRLLIDKPNCLIRTFDDFPSQGETAFEGVVTTYRFFIRAHVLGHTSVLDDIKKYCEFGNP